VGTYLVDGQGRWNSLLVLENLAGTAEGVLGMLLEEDGPLADILWTKVLAWMHGWMKGLCRRARVKEMVFFE
jgi:hypothetical protein